MSMDDMNLRDIVTQGIAAASAGIVGRLVALSRASRSRLGLNLLWELPTAVGLGMLGLAVGEHFHLGWWETNGVGFCIAYVGPPAIDEIIRRLRSGSDAKV
ncbi:MAG: hypothetical protein AB7F35_02020 [Acetobacteraceae bacterium]